jgi:hypothetical protein
MKQETTKIAKAMLDCILLLLPPPNQFSAPFVNRFLRGNFEFAVFIAPFIENLIVKRIYVNRRSVLALASISRLQTPSRIAEIEPILLYYVQNPKFSDSLILFLVNLEDQSSCSRLIRALTQIKFQDAFLKKQFAIIKAKWNVEKQKDFVQFSGSVDFLEQIQTCDYLFETFVNACLGFLATNATLFHDPGCFLPLVKLCHETLLMANLRVNPVLPVIKNPRDFCQSSISINLSNGRRRFSGISVDLDCRLISVEHWFNLQVNQVTSDLLQAAYSRRQELATVVAKSECGSTWPAKLALLNRAFEVPGYQQFRFSIEEHRFSAGDSLFQSVCATSARLQLSSTSPSISLVEGDIERVEFDVPASDFEETKDVLRLLSLIHAMFPQMCLESEKLADKINLRMCPVIETIGRISPLFSMVKCHPWLFPLGTRLLFVQLLTFDVPVALSIFQQNFEKPGAVRNEQQKLSLTVDRHRLFENGVTIFAKLGATPLAFDIRFLGEAGIGVGPTHEFFTLFSEQLCAQSANLWRSERMSGDYVFDSEGLFPRPDASLDLMRVVGTLCAKAFSMSTVVSFAFNPAFFRLVRGEEVNVADVDPARSLGWPEELFDLPFTYPGIPTLQMAAVERVTARNVADYVRLVGIYTCGRVLRPVAAAFRRGFSAVIPWEAMNVFSCEEVCELLRGDACAFTREELTKNVQSAHGYQDDSPQMAMLFDVLLEFPDADRSLFVKFVTGAKALPIGGFAALMPRLTVALRVTENGASPDATFPSVMTCANYLKLPEYSTKEILRERLGYAIRECQNAFELT